ncbi:MAG: CYTH domain-containing protein [Pseudomonadota bacterium]
MSAHLEIEKKYQIVETDLGPLLAQFEYVSEKRIIDEYFDTVDGKFYQEGIFIRIRNQKTLDVKFNPDHLGQRGVHEHVFCAEYSFQEPFANQDFKTFEALGQLIGTQQPFSSSFSSFLKSNQLVILLLIDKIRKTYKQGHFALVIDAIAGLGTILEIEYTGKNTNPDVEQIVSEIDELMQEVPTVPLATGSFEMLLKKQNFELYRKGKYLLEEDRELDKTAA